jgi:U32 family peptidase
VTGGPRDPAPLQLPELLAPAGSPEAFRAAVAAGADAIYLSGRQFGARRYAANFTDPEIEEAARYAHAHDIRVYVTVNTLIHDRELPGVLGYLVWLYSIGVDAVLVQDTGLALLARSIVPGLVLHASTQQTIHSADGVRWAAEHGFSRVVLARELSLHEVSRIAEETKDTGAGLEVFAHGALCYSYSGQCLLSSVIGGRSGNRGMCAQPCRKPYTLVCGETDETGRPARVREIPLRDHYLLSPKDLCTWRLLPGLVRSPVVSLKIEGRMKSPEYVAIVVSTYRQALDAIAAGRWKESPEALADLLLAFNRGFTGGYLSGDHAGALMGRDESGHRGLPVGTVTGFDPGNAVATIRRDSPVTPLPGDGLLFTPPGHTGESWGMALNTRPAPAGSSYTLAVPRPVVAGTRLSVTSSRDLDVRAHRIIAKPPHELLRPVPVDLHIVIGPDGGIQIEGTILRRGRPPLPFTFIPDLRLEPAQSHPFTAARLETQLKKTGGTPFAIRKFTLAYPGNLFAPLAVINALRRDLLGLIGGLLVGSSVPPHESVELAEAALRRYPADHDAAGTTGAESPAGPPLRLSVYTDTLGGIREAARAGADTICYEPDIPSGSHTCCRVQPDEPFPGCMMTALEIARTAGARLVWKLPRIAHDAFLDIVLPALPGLYARGITDCMTENHGTAGALLRTVPAISLSGSIGLNIFNHAAVEAAGPVYSLLTLSPELSREEIRDLVRKIPRGDHSPACALIVQGTSEAMITEDCIARLHLACREPSRESRDNNTCRFMGIRDETGRIFPIRPDGQCRTRIGNAAELCLIDQLPAIRAAGIRDVAIDGRGRPPAYLREMTQIYRSAADRTNAGGDMGTLTGELAALKERVRGMALGGITAGHFLRGLRE